MENAFPLVTSLIQTSNIMVDFQDYLLCKPYLQQKDINIANECAILILSNCNSNKFSLRILDVGSGEGSLLGKIIEHLFNDHTHELKDVTIDCVEPSKEGCAYLKELKRVTGSKMNIYIHQLSIEDFLDNISLSTRYDVILAIHSFYFFPKSKWIPLINMLLNHIANDGFILIDLVSKKSDIYLLYNSLKKIIFSSNVKMAFDEYGYYYFGEDLAKLIYSQANVNVITENIIAPITFNDRELRDFLQVAKSNNPMKQNIIINFLGFMYRIKYNDMQKMANIVAEKLRIKTKCSLTFRSIDFLFELKRRML